MSLLPNNKFPTIPIPSPEIAEEYKKYMKEVNEELKTPLSLLRVIDGLPRWYRGNGKPIKRASQLFRLHDEFEGLIQRLDFLASICNVDEVFTDIDDLGRVREKADIVRQRVHEVSKFFYERFDPFTSRILTKTRLLGEFKTGHFLLMNIRTHVKTLLESYKQFMRLKAKNRFFEIQITRLESVKVPEGLKLPEPDPFAEGDRRAKELIEELDREKEGLNNEPPSYYDTHKKD